ncbi:MAG: chemotaxis protein CheX [Myxococcota bacterium]
MSAPDAEDALRRTAYEILEDGMFLFLEEAALQPDDEAVVATMRVDGGYCATVGMLASPDVARALASNMLGIEEADVSAPDRAAAVAEALNILCGRLLAHLVGEEAELTLHPPVLGGGPDGAQVAFAVEGGQLALWHVPCHA